MSRRMVYSKYNDQQAISKKFSENRAQTLRETSARHSLTGPAQALVCQFDSQCSSRREYLRCNADCLWTACTDLRELRLLRIPGHKKLKNALFLLK